MNINIKIEKGMNYMAVTSAQLYAEIDKIMGVVSQIEDAVSYLTQANNAVSVNQSGLIVETIKNNIGDKQTKLGTASTNLSAAAALLKKYADELANIINANPTTL